jgi:hypothetical protein
VEREVSSLKANSHAFAIDPLIAIESLKNLTTGASVGASQVTAVVRRSDSGEYQDGNRYRIAFSASLVFPGFVRLARPVSVKGELASLVGKLSRCEDAREWRSLSRVAHEVASKT